MADAPMLLTPTVNCAVYRQVVWLWLCRQKPFYLPH